MAPMENHDSGVSIYKRALEITWLAVIFLVPLFFNPQSHQIFAISKASLLDFWLWQCWDSGWPTGFSAEPAHKELKWRGIFTSPLHLSILVFGLVAILATAASITPAISFWGSWDRKSGLLTLICWILFFLIVLSNSEIEHSYSEPYTHFSIVGHCLPFRHPAIFLPRCML